MFETIKPMYYEEIDNPDKGLSSIDICNFFSHILDRYCDIDQTDINDNITMFNQSIDPSLPMYI